MACLALSGVDYKKWIKWVFPLFLVWVGTRNHHDHGCRCKRRRLIPSDKAKASRFLVSRNAFFMNLLPLQFQANLTAVQGNQTAVFPSDDQLALFIDIHCDCGIGLFKRHHLDCLTKEE